LIHETWIQAGLAPFLAGFAVALVFFKLRLGGLAVLTGFCTTAWLSGVLEPGTGSARERFVLLSLSAPALGLVADFAFHAGRMTAYVLGAAFGGAALWAFSAAIMQKPPVPAFILGGGLVLFVAWTVAFGASLHANSVRAGAAALALGLGAGFVALLSGGPFGYLGISVGAAAGGFLALQMLLGQRIDAGLVFCLAAGVQGALVAAGAVTLGRLDWSALAILALAPLAARIPLPARWPVWGQTLLACLYTAACGGAAVATVYVANRGWPSWLK
jgi:hypothetical protein